MLPNTRACQFCSIHSGEMVKVLVSHEIGKVPASTNLGDNQAACLRRQILAIVEKSGEGH